MVTSFISCFENILTIAIVKAKFSVFFIFNVYFFDPSGNVLDTRIEVGIQFDIFET